MSEEIKNTVDPQVEAPAEKETRKAPKNASVAPEAFDWDAFESGADIYGNVDKEKIGAKVADGVLTITLPKIVKDEVKVARQINIG